MNLTFTFPSDFRQNLLLAGLNFGSDTYKAILMRNGFVFWTTAHQEKKHVTPATNGAISYYLVAATKTFTRNGGSFIDDGFIVGSVITTDSTTTNKGPYIVRAVTATTMRVSEATGVTAIVNEGAAPATWVTFTITGQDEMAAITTGSLNYSVVATTSTFERATGSFITNGFVVGTVFSTDSQVNTGRYRVVSMALDGLSMVVEVANGAALADETAVSKTMTNGYTRGGIAVTFSLVGAVLTLDTLGMPWSSFGPGLLSSPGIIIYDDTSANDEIVCYGRITPWTMSF